MSTKEIHDALAELEAAETGASDGSETRRIVASARAALSAIERAAKDMSDNGSDGASVETYRLFDTITQDMALRARTGKRTT